MTQDSICGSVLPLALLDLVQITFTMSAELPAPSVVDHDAHAIFVDISAEPRSLEHLLQASIQALRRAPYDQHLIG